MFKNRGYKRKERTIPENSVIEIMVKQFIYLVFVLSIAMAATQEKKSFSIGSFFEGSWVIASRKVNLETGDVIGEASFERYNVTKTDENEYDIFPLEKNSYLRDRNAAQVVLMTPSDLVGEIKKYNAEMDTFDSLGEFKFVSMLPNESYVFLVDSFKISCPLVLVLSMETKSMRFPLL